jgi:hypothetical protein
VLFIGIGIQPAFGEDKYYSKDENIVTTTDEILENTNCFVMGISKNSYNFGDNRLLSRGTITFGHCIVFGNIWPAEGWIYTSNVVEKWSYNGHFQGANGIFEGYVYHLPAYYYIGIKNFIGLAITKEGEDFPDDVIVIYMGFAESVKIKVDEVFLIKEG